MIETKARRLHMCIDIRGALMNWEDRLWWDCVKDKDGKTLTPREVRAGFLEELAQGHDVVPLGDCDHFDYKEGCLGHPVEGGAS